MLPTFDKLMLPLLRFAADGETHTTHEAIPFIAKTFDLSNADLAQTLSRSDVSTLVNRIAWARVWLGKVPLIEKTEKSGFRITEQGANFLATNPKTLTLKDIKRLTDGGYAEPDTPKTPLEQMEEANRQLDQELREELRARLEALTPTGFEHLVLALVKQMGYGDGTADSATVTSPGADGGIDGVVRQDPLGLEKVYIQAKRWKGSVGSPVVSAFIGSLEAHHARYGVMLTTSSFTADARNLVAKAGKNVVLIDGNDLAGLMIQYGVGTYVKASFKIQGVNLAPFKDF